MSESPEWAVSPLAPAPRRHVRCLGCEVPPGEDCLECSESAPVSMVVVDRAGVDRLQRQLLLARLLNTSLIGALVAQAVLLLALAGQLWG